jgi:hypothetical protein
VKRKGPGRRRALSRGKTSPKAAPSRAAAPPRKPHEWGAAVGSSQVRFWLDATPTVTAPPPFEPRKVALEAMRKLPEMAGWSGVIPRDLHEAALTVGVNSVAVRFHQRVGEYRVRPGEVVVNISRGGQVRSVYRHYHPKLPRELVTASATVSESDANGLVAKWLEGAEGIRRLRVPELIVYHHVASRAERRPALRTRLSDSESPVDRQLASLLEGRRALRKEYYLVWDLRVATERPNRRWRVLIDARTGELIKLEDLRVFASGTGTVFDPNPAVSSGNPAITWDDDALLEAETRDVTLEHLGHRQSGKLHLDGTHVKTTELDDPKVTEPTSASGTFEFAPKDKGFLDTMVYFHIDRFRAYLQDDLALNHIPVQAVRVDPHIAGWETWAGDDDIVFGEEGGAVLGLAPDAADALVIVHEYGHVLQAMLLPDSVIGNEPAGISEGYGDFIVAVYYDDRHKPGTGTRGALFPWSRPAFQLRHYSVNWKFGGPEWNAGALYEKGALWCTTLFEAYRKLGGDSTQPDIREAARALAIRLFTDALTKLPVETEVATSETVLAAAIESADAELDGWWPANGLHRKVLADTFGRRDCTGYRPQDPGHEVDVYIADGRAGGYGSDDGQDHFDQNLWKEDHGASLGKDLWATRKPYKTAAAQANADPAADHVEPAAGKVSNVYVRVRNRGIQTSGPVVVRVFIAGAGPPAVAGTDTSLTWPDAWAPGELLPSLNVATIPAGGKVVVGPLPWTPAASGVQTVLAVVECSADPALTETLRPTDRVAAAALVPFDNNLAMRRMTVS